MNKTIDQLTAHFSRNELLNNSRYAEWLAKIDLNFEADYLEFMKVRNGGEGTIGKDGYVCFWPLEELIQINEDYAVNEFAPELFFIGTNLGGTAYGIRKRSGAFIETEFVGMSDEAAIVHGQSFAEFLLALSE
ncbi:SMI1/KNR4 family protein [Chitinophaga niabensis]|uniref:SMI1/KNR4 family protein n=1 Tax=Chitinophaga niabensis TaxID=536979 RepID=UPI0031BB5D1E